MSLQCDFTKLGQISRFGVVSIGLGVQQKWFYIFIVLRAPEHRETIVFLKVEEHNFHLVLIRSKKIKISRSTVTLGHHSVQFFSGLKKSKIFDFKIFWFSYKFQWHFLIFRSRKFSENIFSIFENFWDRKFSLKIVWKWKFLRSKNFDFFRTQNFLMCSDPNWPCSSRSQWNCFGSKRGENYGKYLHVSLVLKLRHLRDKNRVKVSKKERFFFWRPCLDLGGCWELGGERR